MILGFFIQFLSVFFLYLNRKNYSGVAFWLDITFMCLAIAGGVIVWAS